MKPKVKSKVEFGVSLRKIKRTHKAEGGRMQQSVCQKYAPSKNVPGPQTIGCGDRGGEGEEKRRRNEKGHR